MKNINTNNPVFIIGAPKTGSTSLHIELSNSQKYNYTSLKDTKFLGREDFTIERYTKFFNQNNKPIMEVDQNLAINHIAFINIEKNFNNPTLIYIVRDSKDRFFSAFKWLRKVGLVKNIDEAIEKYSSWMINQGQYKENIQKNIIPYCKSNIIVVKFEELIKNDGITFSALMNMLNISSNQDLVRPMIIHNKSSEPRSRLLIKILKSSYKYIKYLLPNNISNMLKTSGFVEKALYTDTKIVLGSNDHEAYKKFAKYFSETDKFIEDLEFNNGVCCIVVKE